MRISDWSSDVCSSDLLPAWSVLTAAYLFRDAEHLRTFFDSEHGTEMKQMAEDQLGVHILGPTYFGTRQVGLKPDRKVMTPADMAGIKLRMPGGEAWQFLGQAPGAHPTPLASAEAYPRPNGRTSCRASGGQDG